MASASEDRLVGRLLSGRYRVGEEIGRGGMAVVYEAIDQDLERPVAVKVLQRSAAASPTSQRRFLREARAAAKLTNDHVVLVFDVGSFEDGQPWIVMERLEGCDLQQRLDAGPLSVAEAVDFVLQACVALAEAHAAGLVHRDLKPSNLFITAGPDGAPRLKVLDFGIAKAIDATGDAGLTTDGCMMGSPRYMSPEHLRAARDVDSRSDVWSLGVVLFELLSRRSPFPGENVNAVFAAILERPPAPLNASVPEELGRTVYRCLAKERDERFASVQELASAIAPFGSERASGYVQTAVRYGQPAHDRGRITQRARASDAVIETVVDSVGGAARQDTTTLVQPSTDQNTDASWGAIVSPPGPARSRLAVLLVVALGTLAFVWAWPSGDSAPVRQTAPATEAETVAVPVTAAPSTSASAASASTSASASASTSSSRPAPSTSASSRATPAPRTRLRRPARRPEPSPYDERE